MRYDPNWDGSKTVKIAQKGHFGEFSWQLLATENAPVSRWFGGRTFLLSAISGRPFSYFGRPLRLIRVEKLRHPFVFRPHSFPHTARKWKP
jgi:hypothetical protein